MKKNAIENAIIKLSVLDKAFYDFGVEKGIHNTIPTEMHQEFFELFKKLDAGNEISNIISDLKSQVIINVVEIERIESIIKKEYAIIK